VYLLLGSSDLVDFPKPPRSAGKPKFKPRPNEPAVETSSTALIRWIVNYFDNVPQPGMPNGLEPRSAALNSGNAFDRIKQDAVIVSPRMPIILQVCDPPADCKSTFEAVPQSDPLFARQHNGHSRTIIGYEMMKNSTVNLLIFDPALQKKPDNALRKAALEMHYQNSAFAHFPMSASNSSRRQHNNAGASNQGLASRTSRILQHIRHLSPKTLSSQPKGTISNKRRFSSSHSPSRASGEHETGRPVKRFRGSDGPVVHGLVDSDQEDMFGPRKNVPSSSDDEVENDEIIEVTRPPLNGGMATTGKLLKAKTEAEELCDALDPVRVARLFRVNNTTLR
jgi:hypothetical protein